MNITLICCEVQSGVPQGTALGPGLYCSLFTYVNDINCGISYKLQLFADDCILYYTINSQNDYLYLQSDLDS